MSHNVVDLRRNDPATTGIHIILRDESSDEDLAQALQQNPFITDISLNVDGVGGLYWPALLGVIATRTNLETVDLLDANSANRRNSPMVPATLRAIQQNSAIQRVSLSYLCLPTAISTFVDNATSITKFALLQCVMEPAEGARDLAMALERNTNIITLELGLLEEVYALPIFQGLQSNTFVNSLSIDGRTISDATAGALQQVFQSNALIETLEFVLASSARSEFHQVAQGIISSPSVSTLKLKLCNIDDEVFGEILQTKQNLTGLCFDQCGFSEGAAHGGIISALSRPNSPLRSFELMKNILRHALPNTQFENLLGAVQRSKLEHFAIGRIQSQQQLHTLTNSIPLMRIKELEVDIDIRDEEEERNCKVDLLEAVKNNFSLRSFRDICLGRDLFNDDDKARLAFYANRNESLDQWVCHPKTIKQQQVWPDALGLAERAGPSTLFRGLRSVLGGDSTFSEVRRRRKRPQYYAPS